MASPGEAAAGDTVSRDLDALGRDRQGRQDFGMQRQVVQVQAQHVGKRAPRQDIDAASAREPVDQRFQLALGRPPDAGIGESGFWNGTVAPRSSKVAGTWSPDRRVANGGRVSFMVGDSWERDAGR